MIIAITAGVEGVLVFPLDVKSRTSEQWGFCNFLSSRVFAEMAKG